MTTTQGAIPGPRGLTSNATTNPSPTASSSNIIVPNGNDFWTKSLEKLDNKHQGIIRKYQISQPDNVATLNKTLDSLMAKIQDQRNESVANQWTIEIGSTVIVLRDKADSVLDWLNKFKPVVDVAVNADPIHAGLPWAGIRMFVEAANADRDAISHLLSGLDRVFALVRRCDVYEQLYFRHMYDVANRAAYQNMERAIISLYTLILKFLAVSLITYERSTGARAWHSFLNPEELASFDNGFRNAERGVVNEAELLERSLGRVVVESMNRQFKGLQDEISALNSLSTTLISIASTVNNINTTVSDTQKTVGNLWRSHELKLKIKILRWTSEVPYQDHHGAARSRRVEGTGDWIFKRREYQKWRTTDQSAILWVHGIRKFM